MPLDMRDHALVLDMMDSAAAVVDMVREMTLEAYVADRKTRRAVEREIEIIGEAARKISPKLQDEHPEIPWRKITAQRHKLAHEYGEIQEEILWRVATIHIPDLIRQLTALLGSC